MVLFTKICVLVTIDVFLAGVALRGLHSQGKQDIPGKFGYKMRIS